MVDEQIDLEGRIKLLVPPRVIKELCKDRNIRADSNSELITLLIK